MAANEEHGGILLGRVVDPETVEVTGCEFFPSAHRKGTLYDLGARERQRVAMRARELEASRRERPVGYFRTHQRPGLFLDQDDQALMEEAFRGPASIALLMRPRADGPPDAGFFFRENGELDRKQSQLVFPFDSGVLRARGPIESPAPPPATKKPNWLDAAAWKKYQPALLWVGAAGLAFAIVATLLGTGSGHRRVSSNPFDLRVARSGQSLLVDWNRNAPALRDAPSAQLTIDDGGEKQTLTLDRAELEHGSVQFWPQSKHVVVRMDVTNSREISESVTAVVEGGEIGAPAIAEVKPAPAAPAPEAKPAPVAPENTAPAERNTAEANNDEAVSTRPAPPLKPRSFRVMARPSSGSSTPRLDSFRSPAASGSAPNSQQPQVVAAAKPPVQAPPQPVQALNAPPAVTKTIEHVVTVAVKLEPKTPTEMHKVMSHIPLFGHLGGLKYRDGGEDFQAPRPERSLDPKVPGYMADNLRTPVDISVLVSIDKSGKVKSTEVTEGAGTGFGSLAADRAAAIQWEPARMGDKPVASQIIAHFHFRRVEKEVAETATPAR